MSAWEEPPKKQLALKPTDVTTRLSKKWLQLYWPDDGKWWPCQVATVDIRKKTVTLIYETGTSFLCSSMVFILTLTSGSELPVDFKGGLMPTTQSRISLMHYTVQGFSQKACMPVTTRNGTMVIGDYLSLLSMKRCIARSNPLTVVDCVPVSKPWFS